MATVKLVPIVPKTIAFWVIGTSPLIQHKWSQKAIEMLRMTPAERRKIPKVNRDPEAEADGAMYKMPDGSPAIPMLSFKASLIGAAHKDIGIEKTLVRKSLFLPPQHYAPGLIAPLVTDGPEIREDIVRVGNNQTDLRYRPEFANWSVRAIFEIRPDMLNEQDLVTLVNYAGFSVGIGEWRPEKGGEYGRFRFDLSKPIEELGF